MTVSNFNLRGIPTEVMTLLKQEAKRLHTSVNMLILQIIERDLGFAHEKVVYHDLDHLAASWSSTEAKSFEENTASFEKIDRDLWE
jgi:hypothetical protein